MEKTKTQILKEDAEEWDQGREKRTQNWRDFNHKKTKTIKKQKKYENTGTGKKPPSKRFFEMKPAPVKPEERNDETNGH